MLKHEKIELINHTHGPVGELAYLRPNQVSRKYPFSRALVYELLASGDIESFCLRKPGKVRGIRLIPVGNIEAYLAKLAAEQKDEKLLAVVTTASTEQKIAKGPKASKHAPRGRGVNTARVTPDHSGRRTPAARSASANDHLS
jgi:hypothetical protein